MNWKHIVQRSLGYFSRYFRPPWRVGDALVFSENAGRTSKCGHPCLCQSCTQEPPAEMTGRGSLLNRPSCSPDDPVVQGDEPNWGKRRTVLYTSKCPHTEEFNAHRTEELRIVLS